MFREIHTRESLVEFLGRPLLLGCEAVMDERSWDVYPYAGSSHEFRKRTVNAIEAIIATHEGQHVVMACHRRRYQRLHWPPHRRPEDMFFRPAHTAVNVVFAGQHGVRALQSLGDIPPPGRRPRPPDVLIAWLVGLRRGGGSTPAA